VLKSVGSAKTLAKARSAGELSEWLVQGRNLPLGISPASLLLRRQNGQRRYRIQDPYRVRVSVMQSIGENNECDWSVRRSILDETILDETNAMCE
jgi:hypothetical protein